MACGLLAFTLATCFALSLSTSNHQPRINYGYSVETKQPFMATLLTDLGQNDAWIRFLQLLSGFSRYYQHRCGGFIFTERFVVTAAHCIKTIGDNLHLVGVDGLKYREMGAYHFVVATITHPDHTGISTLEHFVPDADIGLVKTETAITSFVPPVIHEPELGNLETSPSILYGWGMTQYDEISEQLQLLRLRYAPPFEFCERDLGVQEGKAFCFSSIKNLNGYAGFGDSGSPIILKTIIVGETESITSILSSISGPYFINDDETYIHMGPNLTYYLEWITENILIN